MGLFFFFSFSIFIHTPGGLGGFVFVWVRVLVWTHKGLEGSSNLRGDNTRIERIREMERKMMEKNWQTGYKFPPFLAFSHK